jgi:hypothetical protein
MIVARLMFIMGDYESFKELLEHCLAKIVREV